MNWFCDRCQFCIDKYTYDGNNVKKKEYKFEPIICKICGLKEGMLKKAYFLTTNN